MPDIVDALPVEDDEPDQTGFACDQERVEITLRANPDFDATYTEPIEKSIRTQTPAVSKNCWGTTYYEIEVPKFGYDNMPATSYEYIVRTGLKHVYPKSRVTRIHWQNTNITGSDGEPELLRKVIIQYTL